MKKSNTSSNENKAKISPNMQKAALQIAQGSKLLDVAKECGISPQTLSEWRSNQFFQVLCNRIQRNILDASEAKLINLATKAVVNLETMLDSQNEKVKFEATKEVLKMTGLTQPVNIGAITYKQSLQASALSCNIIPMSEIQMEIEEAVQEASIVDM